MVVGNRTSQRLKAALIITFIAFTAECPTAHGGVAGAKKVEVEEAQGRDLITRPAPLWIDLQFDVRRSGQLAVRFIDKAL